MEILDNIINDIKKYVKSLDLPDNIVFREDELLIMSCFSKSLEIIEKYNKEEIEETFEYEMFINDEGTPFEMNCWIPISKERILNPENIEKYIKNGLLRRI